MNKIIVNKKELERILNEVNTVIDLRNNIPALTNCYMDIKKEAIYVGGSNNEIYIKAATSKSIATEEQTILISIFDIVRLLPKLQEEELDIEVSKKDFTIKTLSGDYSFPVLSDGSEYPQMKVGKIEQEIKLDLDYFKYAINITKVGIKYDELRPVMSGFGMFVKNKTMSVFGADGVIVSRVILDVENDKEFEFTMPISSIPIINRIKSKEITLSITDKRLVITASKNKITFNTVEQKYVRAEKYCVVGPKPFKINRESIIGALDKAMLLSTNPYADITIKGNKLNLKTYKSENGRTVDINIDCASELKEENIMVNGNKLLSLLKSVDSEKVSLALAENNTNISMQTIKEDKIEKDVFGLLVAISKDKA